MMEKTLISRSLIRIASTNSQRNLVSTVLRRMEELGWHFFPQTDGRSEFVNTWKSTLNRVTIK